MRILLLAVNAKYIHSNLAVYSLRSYASRYSEDIALKEYTINNQTDTIIKGIYMHRPQVLCISCYIWNISIVREIITEIGKLLPDTDIWLGGPEVTYQADKYINDYANVKGVMRGEGEETFLSIVSEYEQNRHPDFAGTDGITYRRENGDIVQNKDRELMDMDMLPFPYKDIPTEEFANRIIYYESSRGCPFSCSYCLSSVEKSLRFRSVNKVLEELQFFLDHNTAQVKFVDRTFNCKKKHAIDIWKYILEHDNGITNFHFEIAADLITDEELAVIKQMRPGLIQLEIGVQSTNPETIRAINRTMELDKVRSVVAKIKSFRNTHQHLDLIAGLPYENLESFKKSFDDIYAMQPDQLQLGFLKLLYGSGMRRDKDEYGIVGHDEPPYEVLFTNWISYDDILELKNVEAMVEMYYNSDQFIYSVRYLGMIFSSAYEMFRRLAEVFFNEYPDGMLSSRNAKCEILLKFYQSIKADKEDISFFKELLAYDLYLRENVKSRPLFLKDQSLHKEKIGRMMAESGVGRTKHHIEMFEYGIDDFIAKGKITRKDIYVEFKYDERDPLTGNYGTEMKNNLDN